MSDDLTIYVGSISVLAALCETCGSKLFPMDSLFAHKQRHIETERTIRRWAAAIKTSRKDSDGGYHHAEKRENVKTTTKGQGYRGK